MTSTPLTAEQASAVDTFERRLISLVTGPPGSGKTTFLKAVKERHPEVVFCAPTGVAADRLSKSIGCDAHVLMMVDFNLGLMEKFRGADVVVDEAGMLSVDDVYRLVCVIAPARIMFVGDVRQLSCIAGNSGFATLLRSGVLPVTEFTECFRRKKGGSLSALVDVVGKGESPPVFPDDDSLITKFFSTDDEAVDAAAKRFKELGGGKARMLTFTNAAVKKLCNKTCTKPGTTLCVGDRVVCKRNTYCKKSKEKKLLVANGCPGVLKRETVVEYDNGFKDTKKRSFASAFEPSRATTIHCAQGLEIPEKIILVLTSWYGKTPAALPFTALTRSKGDGGVEIFSTRACYEKTFSGETDENVDEELIDEMSKAFAGN